MTTTLASINGHAPAPLDTATMSLHALQTDLRLAADAAALILDLARRGEDPRRLDRRLDNLRLDVEAVLVLIDEARPRLGREDEGNEAPF